MAEAPVGSKEMLSLMSLDRKPVAKNGSPVNATSSDAGAECEYTWW